MGEMEAERACLSTNVMAGLVPAIHVLHLKNKVVDAQANPGHDAPNEKMPVGL